MPSYLITGANRGIGFEFLRQLSVDESSTVIGIVRNKDAAEKKIAQEIGRKNIYILEADISDYKSLERAAQETSKITGGSLDYLIANAAMQSEWSGYLSPERMASEPDKLVQDMSDTFNTNVFGNVYLFNAFMPLVLAGKGKKVLVFSTGLADLDLLNATGVKTGMPYAASKAALNVIVSLYNSTYKERGVLFMAISPGVVATNAFAGDQPMPDEATVAVQDMGQRFGAYAPHWTGPITPEESVKKVWSVFQNASLENGDGGSFVSHFGNKTWL